MAQIKPKIYIGPSFPNGKLQRFTVFNNGYTPYMTKLRAQYPEINQLVVPVAKLSESMQLLQRKGSALNVVYNKLKTKLGGKTTMEI